MRYCYDCNEEFKMEDAIISEEVIKGHAIYPDTPEDIRFVDMRCPKCIGLNHAAILKEI